jgi:type IV fimbrial biogenesis protein FimT
MRLARPEAGFTLIELLITLVIMAILLAVGVPSYNTVLVNSRTSALANDLTGAVNLARSEAVKRAQRVQLCPGDDPSDCADGTWEEGWFVLVEGTAVALRRWPAVAANANVTQTPTDNVPITFGELGQRVSADTTFVAQVTGCTADRARQLTLGPVGRVSVTRAPCT